MGRARIFERFQFNSLVISNIPHFWSAKRVRNHFTTIFAVYGKIIDTKVQKQRGKWKHNFFIRFEKQSEVFEAYESIDEIKCSTHTCPVQLVTFTTVNYSKEDQEAENIKMNQQELESEDILVINDEIILD
jgi:hypothetical protein